jgi:hypothetical protein
MLERVHDGLEDLEQHTLPALRRSIEKAQETAVELGELTRDEAEDIGAWLYRDLVAAGSHFKASGSDFGAWLRFDTALVEQRLWDLFSRAADRTSLALLDFREQLERAAHYGTGQVTGPGTLACENCGKQLHFHAIGHIPPCPKCHHTRFERLTT